MYPIKKQIQYLEKIRDLILNETTKHWQYRRNYYICFHANEINIIQFGNIRYFKNTIPLLYVILFNLGRNEIRAKIILKSDDFENRITILNNAIDYLKSLKGFRKYMYVIFGLC